jgi:transcriptional regulator with XRE-family HTH domain
MKQNPNQSNPNQSNSNQSMTRQLFTEFFGKKQRLDVKEVKALIAQKERIARIYYRLTQKDLSERADVAYATLRKFERTGDISLQNLLKIADALDELHSFEQVFRKGFFGDVFESFNIKRPRRLKPDAKFRHPENLEDFDI